MMANAAVSEGYPGTVSESIDLMLLQTNSYIVPKEKRAEHARLLRRFRQTLARLGCHHFEVFEQVGSNWSNGETTGRFVQIMRFRDRKHQLAVQAAERTDALAQSVIAEFCNLINFPYQQQQGLFAVGFYTSVLPVAPTRSLPGAEFQEDFETAADPGALTGLAGLTGDPNAPIPEDPDAGSSQSSQNAGSTPSIPDIE